MLDATHDSVRNRTRVPKSVPVSIGMPKSFRPAEWNMPDGTSWEAPCLACVDEPCRRLSDDEIRVRSDVDLVFDLNISVCPVSALSWDSEKNRPMIDQDACIGCGLCVRRCPTGVMHISDAGHASLGGSDLAFGNLVEVTYQPDSADADANRRIVSELPEIRRGQPIRPDTALGDLLERATNALSTRAWRYLVRNILIELGADASTFREGDVYSRAEGLFHLMGSDRPSPFEIGHMGDPLEVARSVVEDIVLLAQAQDVPASDVSGLVVLRTLPNRRSQFWEVINDFRAAFEIQVSTVSIGLLVLLLWGGANVEHGDLEKLFLTHENTSLEAAASELLGRDAVSSVLPPGTLRPQK